MHGLVLRTFLIEGKPDELRTVELSNSTAYATVFPRSALAKFLTLHASGRPGVYILIGEDYDSLDGTKIYIGEGDPVGQRLKKQGTRKEFWNLGAVFTSKDEYLNKTQIQFLEAELIRLASDCQLSILDNKNTPNYPNISQAEEAEVKGFLDNIMILIGSIGITAFEKTDEIGLSSGSETIFYFNAKSATARLIQSGSSYVVLAGSTACKEFAGSSANWIKNLRNKLVDSKTLKESSQSDLLQFTKNTPFTSPSAAAAIINGGNVNGLTAWKLKNGTSLKELESSD